MSSQKVTEYTNVVVKEDIVSPFRCIPKGDYGSISFFANRFGVEVGKFVEDFQNGKLDQWFKLKNPENENARIVHGDDIWYIEKIDGTHLRMANNKGALEKGLGAVWHVAQLNQQPYYDDLRKWLYGHKEIDGNEY